MAKKLKLLVYTGATASILAGNVYGVLMRSFGISQNVTKLNENILSATNEPLKVRGITERTIHLGNKSFRHVLVVAEIQ